jgi:HAE1 family hydrophobic/amphiphilic exporter-1
MTLPEVCIRRPVFTTMLILLPVVVGIYGYSRMGVDLFPNIEFPTIIVTASRPGASVEEMEIGVTKLIEEAVNTIAGIDELRSTTLEGQTIITVQFVLEKNRDIAQQEVQGKINTIISRLPTGTETPIVDKFDIDAVPVMSVSVSGKRSLRELTELADKRIKESLSGLSGVGAVNVAGGQRRAINVTIDARKLEAYDLTIEQVRQALRTQNLELPGGRVDQSSRELVLRTMGRVEDVAQFNDIIVANVQGQPIRIRDLGDGRHTVVDSYEEQRTLARLDGNNAVTVVVQKQSGTNTVQVIDTVKARLAQLEVALAQEGKPDIRMEVIRDQSRFIKASLDEVRKHLILGAILVSLTILLFLRDWRTMLMASVAIPTSLISTFVVMWAMGFTLNNITMLALVLAIGIVIDDAVVVHENIFRWMEEKGLSAWDAAMGATKEIALAVLATTTSLVVIFLPIAFMSGRVGRWLSSFGVTCAIAITMSLLVSFTMTPMLCSRFLKLSHKAKEAGRQHHSGGIYGWIVEKPYLLLLRWSLRHRWVIVLATVVVTASIFPLPVGKWIAGGNTAMQQRLAMLNWPGLFVLVGQDFLPKEDQSEFEIAITTPEGWTLERSEQVFSEIEQRLAPLRRQGVIVRTLTTIGDTSGRAGRGQGEVTQGSIYLRVAELGERPPLPGQKRAWTQFEIMGQARRIMADYPDLRSSVQPAMNIAGGGGRNSDIEYNLVGPDLDTLVRYSDHIVQRLRALPGWSEVDTTLALRKPELRVNIDRERASDLGVSIQTLSATLRTLVGGEIVSDYKDKGIGEQYDVWLRAQGVDREDHTAVENLSVPSSKGPPVKLGSVANLEEDRGPSRIDRLARQRKISIVANLLGVPMDVAGQTLQQVGGEVERELGIPSDYTLIPSGRAKVQAESNMAFLMAFSFSLVFMYMVLAAQFESFVHPITILLAVPITIPFALLSLMWLGQPLNLYSILGLFLLFGIVKKNGILQVDYANVLRRRAAENPDEVPLAFQHPLSPEAEHSGLSRFFRRRLARMSPQKRIRAWAIVEANRTRLRPILMTTLMLVAGMIPIALGQGPGSGNRSSMAKVIVGGQMLSLLLSLLITPVAYSLLDDLAMWTRRRLGRKSADQPAPASTAAQAMAG